MEAGTLGGPFHSGWCQHRDAHGFFKRRSCGLFSIKFPSISSVAWKPCMLLLDSGSDVDIVIGTEIVVWRLISSQIAPDKGGAPAPPFYLVPICLAALPGVASASDCRQNGACLTCGDSATNNLKRACAGSRPASPSAETSMSSPSPTGSTRTSSGSQASAAARRAKIPASWRCSEAARPVLRRERAAMPFHINGIAAHPG